MGINTVCCKYSYSMVVATLIIVVLLTICIYSCTSCVAIGSTILHNVSTAEIIKVYLASKCYTYS